MRGFDPANTLFDALRTHNPWWADGADAFDLPARQKSDFYHLVRPDDAGSQFDDQTLLGLVGRRGVGKTTLLHQFIHHELTAGREPERFLYLPFDADPLYQLRSDEQLHRAVRYYESRILDRADSHDPHFVILDDVHTIEHPTKPHINGWGTAVQALLEDTPSRHVVVTASAGVQVDRELERVGVAPSAYDTQPILPEKFRDYIYTLYPALEAEETRVSPTSLRTGAASLPAAVATGDVDAFVAEVRAKYETIADEASRIQSQVVDYLALGGVLSYAADAPEDATAVAPEAFADLRDEVRNALYQEVPHIEAIQTIADLDRLCGLAARQRAVEPIRFQELVDLFDVDRRTLRDSYLAALDDLYLVTPTTEYDNARPRAVRLYLRDSGMVAAFTDQGPATVVREFDLEAQLARLAGFDHTMRFAYGIEAAQGRETVPDVGFWQGPAGEIDFVFEIEDVPIPVGLAYRPGELESVRAALHEFGETYEPPIRLLITSDTVRSGDPISYSSAGRILELPYWFYLLLC